MKQIDRWQVQFCILEPKHIGLSWVVRQNGQYHKISFRAIQEAQVHKKGGRKEMLQNIFEKIVRDRRLKGIAKQVRNGKIPKGVTKDLVMEALSYTRPKNAVELFGLLSMRVFRGGELKEDLGLQSVRKVTTAFTKKLADAFCSSTAATNLHNYIFHAVGEGSAAEASGDVLLSNEHATRVTGSQTHGATSNIYKTIRTYAAVSAFTAIEHGIFDIITTSAGTLLDRSLVGTPPTLITGDEVEYTYELTINSET